MRRKEPQNWLHYSGGYQAWRYSTLNQINAGNAKNLQLKWVWQARSLNPYEVTPLVVDGVMYTVQGNDVVALDAMSGKIFWISRYTPTSRCAALLRRPDPWARIVRR